MNMVKLIAGLFGWVLLVALFIYSFIGKQTIAEGVSEPENITIGVLLPADPPAEVIPEKETRELDRTCAELNEELSQLNLAKRVVFVYRCTTPDVENVVSQMEVLADQDITHFLTTDHLAASEQVRKFARSKNYKIISLQKPDEALLHATALPHNHERHPHRLTAEHLKRQLREIIRH